MTAPQPDLSAVPNPPAEWRSWITNESEPRRPARVRPAAARFARSAWARVAGPARLLPGLAAAVCAVAGSWLLWELGVALLVGAALLLLVDARTPRS